MKITAEPGLLDCMALVRTDHKAKRTQLFCLKHGTIIYESPSFESITNAELKEALKPLWRNRSCRDQD